MISRWQSHIENPSGFTRIMKMAMPHGKSIRFHMDNEITLKESIRS